MVYREIEPCYKPFSKKRKKIVTIGESQTGEKYAGKGRMTIVIGKFLYVSHVKSFNDPSARNFSPTNLHTTHSEKGIPSNVEHSFKFVILLIFIVV